MKILGSWWFNEIGIVVTENMIGDRKAYIKKISGFDEESDAKDIAIGGSPVHAQVLTEIIEVLGK